MAKRVVMVGLEPNVVDFSDPAYAAFPGLNAKLLREALEKDRVALVARGYDAIWSFWDNSEGAETKFIDNLRTHKPDCVMWRWRASQSEAHWPVRAVGQPSAPACASIEALLQLWPRPRAGDWKLSAERPEQVCKRASC